MAKKKNKKKSKTPQKPPKTEDAINPFSLRINRERHSVLGRKLKTDRGMPGISRNKAIKLHSDIFKKKILLSTKANRFIDKRFGEDDSAISNEERMIARINRSRQKKYKKNIYNLNDEDETLTHLGQSISDMDAFKDLQSDSDEDDDEKLDARFVKEAHFGGFLKKKDTTDESIKSRKDIIDDMIAESKRKKQEKKMAKEENLDLTEKLDEQWKDIHSIIPSLRKSEDAPVGKGDSYDMTVQELKFEPRGMPASRIKTKEELEKEEKEKLTKLEKERIARMNPAPQLNPKMRYESADSICDGLEIEDSFLIDSADTKNHQESPEDSESDGFPDEIANEKRSKQNDATDNDIKQKDVPSHGVNNSKSDTLKLSFDVPQKLSDLASLLSSDKAFTAFECFTKELSKAQLENLFSLIISYIDSNFEKSFCTVEVLDIIMPVLYNIAQQCPTRSYDILKNILVSKLKIYQELKKSGKSYTFKSIPVLILLKICGVLYSTSDFRHPIVTPCMLFMSSILSDKYTASFDSILYRLFLSSLFYEYVSYSKRLATEPIVFLQSLLFLSVKKTFNFSSSKMLLKNTSSKGFLLIESPVDEKPNKLSFKELVCGITDETKAKISIIYATVVQLTKFVELYSDLPSFVDIFSDVLKILQDVPITNLPSEVADAVSNMQSLLTKNIVARKHLIYPNRKPKLLKLFEPKFNLNYSEKTQTANDKLRIEKQLSKKVRREERGAIRDIRRFSQFVAKQNLKKSLESDNERKRKVKELFQNLAIQEGDYKKLKKKQSY